VTVRKGGGKKKVPLIYACFGRWKGYLGKKKRTRCHKRKEGGKKKKKMLRNGKKEREGKGLSLSYGWLGEPAKKKKKKKGRTARKKSREGAPAHRKVYEKDLYMSPLGKNPQIKKKKGSHRSAALPSAGGGRKGEKGGKSPLSFKQ